MNDEQERSMRAYTAFLGLVGLVKALVERSARGDWRIPLLCLVTGWPSSLNALGRIFTTQQRRVPHVRLTAVGGGPRSLLHQAYEGLATGGFGMDRLRFRHYGLAEWLMTVDLRNVQVNKRQARLVRELRRGLGPGTQRESLGAARALNGWQRLVLWLATVVLPAAVFRLLVAGGRFGIGREFRWFMRQQYLAPGRDGSFLAFARRLTIGPCDRESPEQIDRLLVHAFLQDLRIQYRRRPWRLAAWRRTAGPVLLLDSCTVDTDGYDLLRLINAVRNETGQSDPLLVITSGADVPPHGIAESDPAAAGWLIPLDGVQGAFTAWLDRLPAAVRAQKDTAWYLPLAIPQVDLDAYRERLPPIVPGPVPLPARKLVLVGLVIVLLAGAGLWQLPGLVQRVRANCFQRPFTAGQAMTVVRDLECIGYSDNAKQTFSHDEKLVAVQKLIFQQNRAAEKAQKVKRDRPLVTLVYLGSLTRPDALADEETFAGEREELQGMAAAQARAYLEAADNPASPYLRIVVANAGRDMRHTADVVPMLTDLAHRDATVMAVVGLVESRSSVKRAIVDLGNANIPVIAPVLSADRVAEGATRYLQISAPNVDEAQFVHQHTTQVLKKKKLFNYYTYGAVGQEGATTDLYVNTLREDLRARFGADYDESYWTPDVDLRAACPDRFPDGVVFFGGRYEEFGAFASKLASDCSGKQPPVIGDDSVTRYMANVDARRSAPENLPVAYVAKGALAYCDRLATATDTERQFFYSDIRTVLSLCGSGPPVGERVGLAYDATRIVLKAVGGLAGNARPAGQAWDPSQATPTTVFNQILRSADPYHGVTGLVGFDQHGIAVHKRLSLLCAHNIKQAFRSTGDVPQQIDRTDPDSAPEQTAYPDEQPLVRRACT